MSGAHEATRCAGPDPCVASLLCSATGVLAHPEGKGLGQCSRARTLCVNCAALELTGVCYRGAFPGALTGEEWTLIKLRMPGGPAPYVALEFAMPGCASPLDPNPLVNVVLAGKLSDMSK